MQVIIAFRLKLLCFLNAPQGGPGWKHHLARIGVNIKTNAEVAAVSPAPYQSGKTIHFIGPVEGGEPPRRFPKNAEKLHCCGKASHARRPHPQPPVIPSALPTAAATTAHCSPASGNEVRLTAPSTWSRRRDVEPPLFSFHTELWGGFSRSSWSLYLCTWKMTSESV